jgi:peroxiredoxin (alkyl hydroperoxide reductase subunit C)
LLTVDEKSPPLGDLGGLIVFIYTKIDIIIFINKKSAVILLPITLVLFFNISILMEAIINSQLPEFNVQAYHNGAFKAVSSDDLKGKWSIFFFYPADFTFVCPTELVDMAEKYSQFQAMGVEVYSVSTDTHFVHKAWHDASDSIRKINYPMLADPTGKLCRAFGVMIEEAGLAYRGTFLVDPEGKIKLAEVSDLGIGRNADEILRKVQAAQFIAAHPNEVCPAKWQQGGETLKPSIDLVGKI